MTTTMHDCAASTWRHSVVTVVLSVIGSYMHVVGISVCLVGSIQIYYVRVDYFLSACIVFITRRSKYVVAQLCRQTGIKGRGNGWRSGLSCRISSLSVQAVTFLDLASVKLEFFQKIPIVAAWLAKYTGKGRSPSGCFFHAHPSGCETRTRHPV